MRTQIRVAGMLEVDAAILVENFRGSNLWNLPGGRLEDNETLELALKREFQEELGVAVETGELLIVNENFFPHAGDVIREYGFYFRVRTKQPLAATAAPGGREPRLRCQWVAPDQLGRLDFRPAGLIQHLIDPPAATLYVKTRDAELIGGG